MIRLISGMVMLAFVVCHLTAHAALLIAIEFAQGWLSALMYVWRTKVGYSLLIIAFVLHYGNALWSLYIRRTLKMPFWEWCQITLGFFIPVLIAFHVAGTGLAEVIFKINLLYSPVLIVQWVRSYWASAMQMAAVIVVWAHACIGIHFWLRTKPRYQPWKKYLGFAATMLPTLALAGYVSAGNQLVRMSKSDPETIQLMFDDSNMTDATLISIDRIALVIVGAHLALTLLILVTRLLRDVLAKRNNLLLLSHAGGGKYFFRKGATVLEALRENSVAHAAVCGGRGRCTTCRVLVTYGMDDLPMPGELEAGALARIAAASGVRLACQIRPNSNISIMPLLRTDASAVDGVVKGGLEGRERSITVMFVDLRDSTALSEARMPYDVLFLLNQFFHEMTQALTATRGHYSQFTGDGLMALYGLHDGDGDSGTADAIEGAREMLARLGRLNERLAGELAQPLRIGIGIHSSIAIVGAMGPPGSQIITAIGDLVNTCARLESLSKKYGSPVVISKDAADRGGLDVDGLTLHEAPVRGRAASVKFYALDLKSAL